MASIDHDRIAAAIAAAEANTAGEIFAVVETEPQAYPATAFVAAVLTSFAVPLMAVLAAGFDPRLFVPADGGWSTGDSALDVVRALEAYAALQALVFVAVYLLVRHTALSRWLTPHGVKRERVHDLAMTQFLSHGVHVTEARTGVLLFLSIPDHVAEVVADEGIFGRTDTGVWTETVDAMIAGAKRGDLTAGFEQAIGIAGKVLAEHYPPSANDSNELPDRLVVL